MKYFCVPASFENNSAQDLSKLNLNFQHLQNQITEVYGSLPFSFLGSARSPDCVPITNWDCLKKTIKELHQNNIKFNYLINSPCLGNKEFTPEGRKEIFLFLEKLTECSVDYLTITIPFLMELVKKNFANFKINTSVICYIDSVDKAKYYENIGVDRITLDLDINRNFSLIKKIKEQVSVPLEVLLNSPCIYNCALKYYHYNLEGHFSQEENYKPLANDFCKDSCMQMLLNEPYKFLASPWIRPEDINFYCNELGIEYFKIVGREYKKNILLFMAENYLQQNYSGNLLALLGAYQEPTSFKKPLSISIDNKKLNNFLDFFKKDIFPCVEGCNACGYCENISKEVLQINTEVKEQSVRLYELDKNNSLNDMVNFKPNGFKSKFLQQYYKIKRYYEYLKSGQIGEKK